MAMTEQQKRERAARVHALGLVASDALVQFRAQLIEMGEHDMARRLAPIKTALQREVAARCNELERPALPRPKTLSHPDYSEHIERLKREYAVRPRPPLRVVESVSAARDREVLDAG
jgi:hypothetical protein